MNGKQRDAMKQRDFFGGVSTIKLNLYPKKEVN